MNIYASNFPSEKVMPYVYMCTHKITGQFYIGSRTSKRQKLPSHLDFPNYKTSSNYVKPIFDQFDWYIIAEFFDSESAYHAEQELIYVYLQHPLNLNKHCTLHNTRWNTSGRTLTEEHKQKLSVAGKGRKHSEETRKKMSCVQKGRIVSEPTKQKISAARAGVPRSETTKQKISAAGCGKKRSDDTRTKMSKTWCVLSPDGVKFVVINLHRFCIERGLTTSALAACAQGKHKAHKGWKCAYMDIAPI